MLIPNGLFIYVNRPKTGLCCVRSTTSYVASFKLETNHPGGPEGQGTASENGLGGHFRDIQLSDFRTERQQWCHSCPPNNETDVQKHSTVLLVFRPRISLFCIRKSPYCGLVVPFQNPDFHVFKMETMRIWPKPIFLIIYQYKYHNICIKGHAL